GDVPGWPAQGRVPARIRARLLLRRPDRPRPPCRAPCALGPCGQRHLQPAQLTCRATMSPLCEGPVRMKTLAKLAVLTATTHKVLALTPPYFGSEQKWKARAMLAAIVLLNLAAVYMLV